MEGKSPLPTKYKQFYVLIRREQRSLFPTNHCVFWVYRPTDYGSGKMPDLQGGDIVGFHGSPFNPIPFRESSTYGLPNVNLGYNWGVCIERGLFV